MTKSDLHTTAAISKMANNNPGASIATAKATAISYVQKNLGIIGDNVAISSVTIKDIGSIIKVATTRIS